MNTISNNIIKLLTIASTILVLASCGSSDSGSSGATGFSATVVAARVTNASCTATVVANGTRTTTVAATSNANGSVFFSTSNTGNTLIECSGGTYTDEATGATNTFVTGTLTAAVNAQSGGEYVVSPLSSLAWLRAGQNPVLIDQVINTFNTEVGRQFGLGTGTATADVTTLIPTDLAAPNAVIDPNDLNDQYAVALAVVSQIGVNTGNTNTAAVTNHLAGTNTTTNDIRGLIATALTNLEASTASAVASVIDATATATIRMNNTNTVAINSITLPATSTVTIGSTITVQATASPAEAVDTSVVYSSSNPTIASVDTNTGVVTGVSDGTATITATANGANISATISITVVRAPLPLVYNNNNPIQHAVTAGTLDLGIFLAGNLGGGTITYQLTNNNNNIGTTTPAGIFTPQGTNTGSATLVVSVAQTTDYLAGSVTTTLEVLDLLPQNPDSLTFTDQTPSTTFDNGVFTQAVSNNNATGAITYRSSNTNIATVDNNGRVTFIIAGTVDIIATAAGDITATVAPLSVRYTLVINRADQMIEAGPDQMPTFGDAGFTQSATGNLTTPLTYSSNNTAVATVDANGAVTIGDAGRAVITVTAPQDERYNLATDTYQVVVERADQMIEAGADQTRTFGAANFTQVATGNSSTAVVTYASNNTAVATVDANGVVTIGDAGSAVITATAPESTNYNQASDSYSITVEQAPLMLVYNGGNTIIHSISAGTLNLSDSSLYPLTGNLGNGVITYSITNNNANIGTTTPAGIFTPQGTNIGTVTLTVNVAPSDNYLAGSTTVTLDIIALPQQSPNSLTFTNQMITVAFDDNNGVFTQTVTNSGAVGAITYRSSDTDIATVDNSGRVTFVIAGTVTITATAAGDNTLAPFSTRYTLVINRANQTISISDASVTFGAEPLTVTADSDQASATGAVTATLSSNDEVARILNGQINIEGGGSSTITVQKAQDERYNLATTTFTLTVDRANQIIDAGPDQTRTFVAANFTQAATGNITALFYTSSNPNVAAVNDVNGEVTIEGVGSTVITATAFESNDYNRATDSYSITVERAPLMLVYNNNNPIQRSVMAAGTLDLDSFSLMGNSGAGAVAYTFIDGDNVDDETDTQTIIGNLGEVGGNTNNIFTPQGTNIGNATLLISVPQTTNYLAGSTTTTLSVVDGAVQALGSLTFSIATRTITVLADNFTQPVDINGGVGTLTYSSSQPTVATVNTQTGEVDVQAIGQSVISAQLSGGTQTVGGTIYAPSFPARYTLSVIRETQTAFDAGQDQMRTFGDTNAGFTQTPTGNSSTAVVTYASDNDSVATVDAVGAVTIGDAGRAVITVTAPQDNIYFLATDTYQVVVERADQTIEAGADQSLVFNAPAFTQVATGNSSTAVVTYASSNPDVATVNQDGLVVILGAGSAVITATAPADNNYNPASDSYNVTVAKDTLPDFNINNGNPFLVGRNEDPFSLSELTQINNNNGGAPVTVSLISNPNSVISNITTGADGASIITLHGTNMGVATLIAEVDESANYLGASITFTLEVLELRQQNPANLVLNTSEITVQITDSAFSRVSSSRGPLGDPDNNGLVGGRSATSSNNSVVEPVNSNIFDPRGLGTATITVRNTGGIALNGFEYAPIQKSFLVRVVRTQQVLTIPNAAGNFGSLVDELIENAFSITTNQLQAVGTYTATSSNSAVAQISESGRQITFGDQIGTTTITVTRAQDDTYSAAQDSFVLEIRLRAPVLDSATPTGGRVGTNGDQVRLDWTETANADLYTVYYQTRTLTLSQTDNGGIEASNLAQMTTATTTAITFTTPTLDGNRYYFVVSATVSGIQSLTSNQRDAVPFANIENINNNNFREVWMSRNLGAIRDCTAHDDRLCFGDLYQWGRQADGHQLIDQPNGRCFSTSAGTFGDSVSCDNGAVRTTSRASSITNVGNRFINTGNSISIIDWTTADSDRSARVAAWANGSDQGGICPPGYRVPTRSQFENAYDATGNQAGFNTPLKLPTTNIRESRNARLDVNTIGGARLAPAYWTGDRASRQVFFFNSNTDGVSIIDQNYGLPVRCIND